MTAQPAIYEERLNLFHKAIEHSPALQHALQLKLTKFIPHAPTPKQRAFLLLPHREAFYGGAAGGGKSDALLMGALQYVDVPKFSALIIRKTLADADQPGAILYRMAEWMRPWLDTGLVSGGGAEYTFHNPDGDATVKFGYLSDYLDRFRYQGSEFQYIAFDEVTQFYEEDYTYLLSRLRRTKCPYHEGRVINGKRCPLPHEPHCPSCQEFAPLSKVPLRLRAAANPGGLGHLWVKKRFDIRPAKYIAEDGKPKTRTWPNGKTMFCGHNVKRPFIPSLLSDNPFLDQKEYGRNLRDMDPVTREQLLNGDWQVTSDGRLKRAWFKYYSWTNDQVFVLGEDRRGESYRLDQCFLFQIIDPAGSVRSGPGKLQVFRGGASWTVLITFILTPDNHLLVLDVRRDRLELPDIYNLAKKQWKMYQPAFIGMEYTAFSIHMFQAFVNVGLPMKAFKPKSQDKIERAIPLALRAEQGKIWLPQTAPWLEALESELFTWTGDPAETDDQIDVMAYGAKYVAEHAVWTRGEDSILRDQPHAYQDDMRPEIV